MSKKKPSGMSIAVAVGGLILCGCIGALGEVIGGEGSGFSSFCNVIAMICMIGGIGISYLINQLGSECGTSCGCKRKSQKEVVEEEDEEEEPNEDSDEDEKPKRKRR